MRAEDVKAFLNRPWGLLRDHKDRQLFERVDRLGLREAIRLGDALRESAYELSGGPRPEERAEDLRDLLRLKRLLDQTSGRRRR